jgi:hypothetical protein
VGGTTYEGSTTSSASSAYIAATGFISANVTNDFGMQVNRTGTDGALFNFRKNGADVGSIGANGGDLTIHSTATSHVGLIFGNTRIQPTDNAGAVSNGASDLGYSNSRFKDLYLSEIATVGNITTTTAGGTTNLRLGLNAGDSIADGALRNTVVGSEAGTALTVGDDNVAVGYAALDKGTNERRNVAVGAYALTEQLDAGLAYNVAVGYTAGNAVTTGTANTLIGGLAGDALSTSSYNVALGYLALSTETAGQESVAIGSQALATQNVGSGAVYNTAVGTSAGRLVTTGINNTLVGGQAGDAVTTGGWNTLIGQGAGSASLLLTTGGSNTLVGSNMDTTAADATFAMGLGYALDCAAGYTTLGQGATDIRAAHGNVTWATVSDERYKKDIVDSTAGLSFINALQPRTFKYKTLGELPETFTAYEADSTEVFKNSNTNHGFIAQEVKAAIDADSSIKDGFRLWDERDDGGQEVAEAALIPILVKAIQELTARVAELEG